MKNKKEDQHLTKTKKNKQAKEMKREGTKPLKQQKKEIIYQKERNYHISRKIRS